MPSTTSQAIRSLPAVALPVALPQRAQVRESYAQGLHPATSRPVATCGACTHLSKREVDGHPSTFSCAVLAATVRRRGRDMRPEWPACDQFSRSEQSIGAHASTTEGEALFHYTDAHVAAIVKGLVEYEPDEM